jgi:hypothetical protein
VKSRILILLLLTVPLVFAECDKVFVVNFNYDNGAISYKEKIMKCGYAPDRLIQPSDGYIAEMVSFDDKVLYSFRFDIPIKVNIDSSKDGELSGGIILLNETDFALVFPYYDNVKSIVVYNPRNYEIVRVSLEDELLTQRQSLYWIFAVVGLLLTAGYMIFRHFKPAKDL